MNTQSYQTDSASRVMKLGVSVIFAAVLSACANYAGIHSDKQMAKPQQYETTQSDAPAETVRRPAWRTGPISSVTRN